MTLDELCDEVVKIADELAELGEVKGCSVTGPAVVDIHRFRQLVKLKNLLDDYFSKQ